MDSGTLLFLPSVAVVFETLTGVTEISTMLTYALELRSFRLFGDPRGWILVTVGERAQAA
jgi:hypothetical protein